MSMLQPVPQHDGDEHRFWSGPDGMHVEGWPCPTCGHEDADVVHLEPPYGALARCRGTVTDPDWGVPRRCATEYPIAF